MAEYSSHHPGTFSWVELATSDQKAGIAFYRALFGWDVHDIDMGPDGVYSMLLLRGKDVGAACSLRPEERQGGVPPHWNLYVTVNNADEAVNRASSLGGTVIAPAFDVPGAGRMAVLQDPTGAIFQVWQPVGNIGAKLLNEPGALCWSELTTRDPKRAEAFYTELFGWAAKHSAPSAVMQYTEFSVNGQPSIGMMPFPEGMPASIPSYWMPYFQVENCDASTSKAQSLGAQLMVGPQDIPNTGRFTIMRDPQGAVFAVFEFTGA